MNSVFLTVLLDESLMKYKKNLRGRRKNRNFLNTVIFISISLTRVHAKSQESSLLDGYNSKLCIQMNHNKNLVSGAL